MFQCFFLNKKWLPWSILGTLLIIAVTWYQVSLDVQINDWFGEFYDMIQVAVTEPNTITFEQFLWTCFTFFKIAGIYIIVAVLIDFFTRHYIFRWRTAMNDYYTAHWDEVRHIEGASQRIQEDTMRFASIMETLGVNFMRSVMTLIAFMPLLVELGKNITTFPIFGEVQYGLVYLAIIVSLGGTILLAVVGIKLPGLEFNNQKVEAAYRKELVYGEDHANRADPETLSQLFGNVRKNYFKLYWNYLYFDLVKWSYLQANVLLVYIAMGPTIVAGVVTFGVIQQTVRAFGKVEESFKFFVYSWGTVIELLSIYKRLRGFERQIQA